MISERPANFLPPVMTDPAPTILLRLILAPFITIAHADKRAILERAAVKDDVEA
ncbi:hypothetical protein IVB22_31575 [Bradyrhizobium sp. 190]|nr:hypothetical protein [Bradyrhizobium sp. 190]